MVSSGDLNLMTDDLRLETFLIVGTDTGVGKTVFTGLFARYLMDAGVGVRAVKPFCAGGKADIELLQAAHGGGLGQEDLNFWYCDEPISPAAAELRLGQAVDFEGCLEWLQKGEGGRVKEEGEGEMLLIEGVGGLLAPLAKGRTVASLGQALGAHLIVVASNRVGVINQVLLTVEAAAQRGLKVVCVVLMGQKEPDDSVQENADLVREFLPEMDDFKRVFEFPWLGLGADDTGQIGVNIKKVEKVLAQIYDACKLRRPSGCGVSDQPSG